MAIAEDISSQLVEESSVRWRIPPSGEMRVPGIVFASEELLPDVISDRSLWQVKNVATLKGIVGASYAMPDVHWGYGFPVGGVAATDIEEGGVVSPGGVGFDISCGVRLMTSSISEAELGSRVSTLMDELEKHVPAGLGRGGIWKLTDDLQLRGVLLGGARYVVEEGFGVEADLQHCEDYGVVFDAEPEQVSESAKRRGLGQVGSLGSGNHFLEVEVVDTIYDETTAKTFGLRSGQVCVMIHCGSRGLGHQICSDHVRIMLNAMDKYGISVPDAQLACAPVDSPEGQGYLGAMAAAANYGRANRQLLTMAARNAFTTAIGSTQLNLLYDVSHNLAKLEWHTVDGKRKLLCVHRKGATRALPPQHPDLPEDFAEYGQPVFIPGSMGTASYVLAGRSGGDAFFSTCHGAGRTMSRHAALKQTRGWTLKAELKHAGIDVRSKSDRGIAEEAPFSYKDVDEVVRVSEEAGLARRVARLRPIGVVKG